MPNVVSYDLGWMLAPGLHIAHWFRTNDNSQAAVSHCGAMFSKLSLGESDDDPHCGYCQTVQDTKDTAAAAQQRAISPHKPLPVGVQTGKRSISNE